MKWFLKKEQKQELPDSTSQSSSSKPLNPEPDLRSPHERRHNSTPDKYISFCKECCSIDCPHQVKNEGVNFALWGACVFYNQSVCNHSKNPDTIAITKSFERSRKFHRADEAARKAAGLENKPGTYSFICPNCQALCQGSWVEVKGYTYLHGSTGCPVCGIALIV